MATNQFDQFDPFNPASSASKSAGPSGTKRSVATALTVLGFFAFKCYSFYERSQEQNRSLVVSPFMSQLSTTSLPQVELQLHSDGCGVIRPEIDPAPHGLGWSVKDQDGFEVLQRNALGETHYRYFSPGRFTIELVAWDGEKYAPMSNRLTINC